MARCMGAESIALVPRTVVSAWCVDRAFCQIVVKALASVPSANDAPEHHRLPCDRYRGVYVALIESGEQCQHGSALIGFEAVTVLFMTDCRNLSVEPISVRHRGGCHSQ